MLFSVAPGWLLAQNVGIGTPTPGQKLDVEGWIRVADETAPGADVAGSIRYNATLNCMQFYDGTAWNCIGQDDDWTRGTDVMYPTNINDNVGIGTTTPNHELEVAGNLPIVAITDNDNPVTSTLQYGLLGFYGNAGALSASVGVPVGNRDLYIQNNDDGTGDGIRFRTDGNDRMYIDENGNVGIGTLVANDRLEVNGNMRNTAGDWFITSEENMNLVFNDDDDNHDFFLRNDGTAILLANGLTNEFLFYDNELLDLSYLNFGTQGGAFGYGIRDDGGTMQYKNNGGAWTNFGGGASLWTQNVNDIFYNTGNVGIGDNTPTHTLHVTTPGDPAIAVGNSAFNAVTSGRIVLTENMDTYSSTGQICGFEFRYDGNANELFLETGCPGNNQVMAFERATQNIRIPNFAGGGTQNLQVDNTGTLILGGGAGAGLWENDGTDHIQPTAAANPNVHSEGDFITDAFNGVINCGGGAMDANLNIISDGGLATFVAGDEDLYIDDDLEVGDQAYKPGGGNWLAPSDRRLKTDVQPFTDGLNTLMAINPVSYRYNGEHNLNTEGEYIGVIAQDVQQVAPYMVEEMALGQRVEELPDGTERVLEEGEIFLGYDGTAMTYILVNAVKELKQEKDALVAENEQLRAELEELRAAQAETDARLQRIEQQLGAGANK